MLWRSLNFGGNREDYIPRSLARRSWRRWAILPSSVRWVRVSVARAHSRCDWIPSDCSSVSTKAVLEYTEYVTEAAW